MRKPMLTAGIAAIEHICKKGNETMTQATHTQGPWEVLTGLGVKIRGTGNQKVADVTVPYGDDLRGHVVTKANARLIAAAPSLLAALENMTAIVENIAGSFAMRGEYGWENDDQTELDAARAAIAKAKGESSK
jgi:hypothetical protein